MLFGSPIHLNRVWEESLCKKGTLKWDFSHFLWFSHMPSNFVDLVNGLKDIETVQIKYRWKACDTYFIKVLDFLFLDLDSVNYEPGNIAPNSYFRLKSHFLFFFSAFCSFRIPMLRAYCLPNQSLCQELSKDISFVSFQAYLIIIWCKSNYKHT